MKFPVSAPGYHPIQETFFVDFSCRRFDGVYPAVRASTEFILLLTLRRSLSCGTQGSVLQQAGLSVTVFFLSFFI